MIDAIKIDIETMKLGEQEEFETLAKCSLHEVSEKGLSGRRLAALIYVFSKRVNPDITFKECLNLDMNQATKMIAVDVDPKELTD